jgi:hypothetical protein
MSIAVCAVMMVVCVMCVFGMGIMGKLAARWRGRSEEEES